MPKPIVKRIGVFDAAIDYSVEISWTGNRSYALRVIIYDNDTNNVVYDQKNSGFTLNFTVPKNTLTNGKSWVIQAQTFDRNGDGSPLSDKVLFKTLATPTFTISNIPDDNRITTSSFNAQVSFNSNVYEALSTYTFYLYDSTKRRVFNSESLFDSTVDYTFRGLENDTVYYIQCVGSTVSGMILDTGLQQIYVRYENPSAYSKILVENLENKGCVRISTNLVVVQYTGDEEFEFEDGRILLNDKKLYYDQGFGIKDDFTLIVRAMNMWQNDDEIIVMKNNDNKIVLSSHIYNDNQLRFRLTVTNGFSRYIVYSSPVSFNYYDLVTIAIRREDNLYQIKTSLEYGRSTDGNYWWGVETPVSGIEEYDNWINTDDVTTVLVDKNQLTVSTDPVEPEGLFENDLWFGEE